MRRLGALAVALLVLSSCALAFAGEPASGGERGSKAERVVRLAGTDRYGTAAVVAREAAGHPEFLGSFMLLASGHAWPDAIAAAPYVRTQWGGIALTDYATLPPATAELFDWLQAPLSQRLLVRIVGGTAVVSPTMDAEIDRRWNHGLGRTAGRDRYETAFRVGAADWNLAGTVWVVTGENWRDALVFSGFEIPNQPQSIILTRPDSLPSWSAEFLRESQRLVKQRVVVGSRGSIRSGAVEDVRRVVPNARWVESESPVTLAAELAIAAAEINPRSEWRNVVLATVEDFPDALSAGWARHWLEASLLYSRSDCVPVETLTAIDTLDPETIFLIGGPAALSSAVASLAPCTGPDS